MANLIDVSRQFGTEDKCLDYLQAARWPSGVACLKCGSLEVGRTDSTVKNRKTGVVVKTRRLFDCREKGCAFQFSVTTGTIFHDSHLPLSKWFLAVALYCDAKKSISALQLQRHLGIGSYKTAWHLARRIRRAMEDGGSDPFTSTVEVDETYIGGRFDKRRRRGPWQKQPVFGALRRGTETEPSRVRSFPVRKASAATLVGAVRDTVSPAAEMLCTDESNRYRSLESDYNREMVNHIAKQYARRTADGRTVTTNSIENFWSLFKRGLVGSYHAVSVKHLSRYLDEFTFRFNNRHAADLFGITVSRMVNAIRLPYAELTATE